MSTRYLRIDSSLHVFAKQTFSYLVDVPEDVSLRQLLDLAFQNEEIRNILSQMPITQQRAGAVYDPELHPGLQDLADIIVFEADDAIAAEYYPRLPNVDVPDEHVVIVMNAMQREINRESGRLGKAAQLNEMSWDRQCALAERRRYWYGFFGITPSTWPKGIWSMWEVPDEELPGDLMTRLGTTAMPPWFYPSSYYGT